MEDDKQKIEANNQSSEQKAEKRKKKKRRGKASSLETQNTENKDSSSNPTQETPLLTVSDILTNPNFDNKLPDNPNDSKPVNNLTEKTEEEHSRKKKKKKKKNEEETIEIKVESETKSGPMETVQEKITYKENNINHEENNVNHKENNVNHEEKIEIIQETKDSDSKVILNSQKLEKKPKAKHKKEVKTITDITIPIKDINPLKLFEMDEDDDEINYLPSQKAYDLSVFLGSHKFITQNKNFDKKFINLVKRKIIRFERNIYDLVDNDKFFILYELQLSENTDLSLSDIITLDAIKSILSSYPSVHLIIQISDEEFSNKNQNKYDDSTLRKFVDEKLSKILTFLEIKSDDSEKIRVHAFSTSQFKSINTEFENGKTKLKEKVDEPKLKKLFNINDSNELLMDYPLYLAMAASPSIYTKYIPEIDSEYTCLIINSIFYMNRYLLCLDASQVLGFNEPALIALKILPPLNGVNGKEANYDLDKENNILSSDDDRTLQKKIFETAHIENEADNEEKDVIFQYLSFLENDNESFNIMKKKFGEGKVEECKKKVLELVNDLLKVFKDNKGDNFDVNKIMIE